MMNTLKRLNSRLDEAEDQPGHLKDKVGKKKTIRAAKRKNNFKT